MSYVHRTVKASIATLTIVRPPVNALDRDSLDELDGAIGEVEQDTKTHALVWAKRVLTNTPEAVDRGAWEEECFAQVWGGEDWQTGLEAMLANRPAVFSKRAMEEPR